MASSLSNLASNPSKGLPRITCKLGHQDKKCETCGIKYKYCDFFLKYTNFRDDLIEHKCLVSNKNCQTKFDEKLKDFLIHTNFLTMITISLFYYKKVFILTNIWMIGKNSMKHYYLKKKTFIVT